MPRPKKLSSDEMVSLVDSFFSSEVAGDPTKLKCSLLEKYAVQKGFPVKAYDFRRDEKVRARIDELKCLSHDENGMTVRMGTPYKNLDIECLLKVRRNPDELREALRELDAYWQKVYETIVIERRNFTESKLEKQALNKKIDVLDDSIREMNKEIHELKSKERNLVVENRYLRKMLRTYLYPALANEILTQEQLLKDADTNVTEKAKSELIDGSLPSSVSGGIARDYEVISKEQNILKQMWDAVPEATL